MGKKIISLFLIGFTMCIIASCTEEKNSSEYSDTVQENSSAEIIIQTEASEEQKLNENNKDDMPPLMIYYNDTVYYLKESLFVISEDKFRSYDIAENYESIGTIDIFVHPNEYPMVNNSCNFSEEKFEIYKYSDDNSEFITALNGRIQIWETEEKHNQ